MALQTDPTFLLSSGRHRIIAQGRWYTREFSSIMLVMSILLGYDVDMENSFHYKKACVIGGSGAIGREISGLLAAEGAQVCSVGRHVVSGIDGVDSVLLDLENQLNRTKAIELARDADILCVIWGPFIQKPLHETTMDEWESMAMYNLAFPGALVSSALAHMVSAHWGRILLVGGTRTDAVRGFVTNAAYAAAKTGLSTLAKSVAMAYALSGVTCNVVCPGFVDTEHMDSTVKNALAAKNPDGVLISPSEIAELSVFLLKNALYNGTVVTADKGWSPVSI